jgi:hypothetical protein
MKVTIKNIWKSLSRVNGNSLAEFATVSALMATLAATAAPKLSEVSEGTKAQKTMNEIDKMLTQAKNFYQDTADIEGRGRFPGQDKYDEPVGGYDLPGTQPTLGNQMSVKAEVEKLFTAGDATALTSYTASYTKFRSVFGESNADAYNGGTLLTEETWSNDAGAANCATCPGTDAGHDEWLKLMGESAMASPYQDGHYVYIVVPGGGTGNSTFPPALYIADVEDPTSFNAVLEP